LLITKPFTPNHLLLPCRPPSLHHPSTHHPAPVAPAPQHHPDKLVAAQPTAPPHTGRLPKLLFPRFDGDNPRHWHSLCEDYFDMYSIPSTIWIRVAKQHLDKGPARWFPSIESNLDLTDWPNLCRLLHNHFDRD
jgi:hypothetical protein